MSTVRRAAQAVLAAMTSSVLQARESGAAVGEDQAEDEAAAVGSLWGTSLRMPPRGGRTERDVAAAEVAGASFAAAWLAAALLAVAMWDRRRVAQQAVAVRTTVVGHVPVPASSPASVVRQATKQLDYRIVRIVVTETAKGRTDAHRERTLRLVRENPKAPWGSKALRRWDARLDRVVCSRCREHESEETSVDGTFKHGDEPGEIHPGCRCIATTIALPLDREEVVGINATSPALYIEGSGEIAA